MCRGGSLGHQAPLGGRAADARASPATGAACPPSDEGTRLAGTVTQRPHSAVSGAHRDLLRVSTQPGDTQEPSRGAAPEPHMLPPNPPSPGNLLLLLFWNFREAGPSQCPAPPRSRAPRRRGSGLPLGPQGPERTPHRDGDPGGRAAGTQGPGRGLARAAGPPLGSGHGAGYAAQRPGNLRTVPPRGQSLPSQDLSDRGAYGVARKPCGDAMAWRSPKAGGAEVPKRRLTPAPRRPAGSLQGLCVFPGRGRQGCRRSRPSTQKMGGNGALMPGWGCQPGRLFGARLSETSQRDSALHSGLQPTLPQVPSARPAAKRQGLKLTDRNGHPQEGAPHRVASTHS